MYIIQQCTILKSTHIHWRNRCRVYCASKLMSIWKEKVLNHYLLLGVGLTSYTMNRWPLGQIMCSIWSRSHTVFMMNLSKQMKMAVQHHRSSTLVKSKLYSAPMNRTNIPHLPEQVYMYYQILAMSHFRGCVNTMCIL